MLFLKRLFSRFSKSSGRKRTAQRVSGGFVPSGVSNTTATVLLAEIHGAGGDSITEYLADIFGNVQDLAVYRRKESLSVRQRGTLFEALQAATDEGGRWLKDEEADLLIWGETIDLGTAVTLRFLPADAQDGSTGVFGPGDHLTIPIPLPTELDSLVLASGIGALVPVHKGSRPSLGKILEKRLARLDKLWTDPPKLEPAHLASVLTCYGNAWVASSRLGNAVALDKAVDAYKLASEAVGKNQDVLTWALAQNHHAGVLQSKALRDADMEALEGAAAAYLDIAEALDKDSYPMDWALAEINRGMALFRLGNKDATVDRLKESAEAFKEALSVFSRETMPGRWAEAMTQYGTVLLALGERLQGEQVLDSAVGTFRKALEIRQKEIVPLLWAQTANNLGAASFALAKRRSDKSLMEDAKKHFVGARDIYKASGNLKRVRVIEKNLARLRKLEAGNGKAAVG